MRPEDWQPMETAPKGERVLLCGEFEVYGGTAFSYIAASLEDGEWWDGHRDEPVSKQLTLKGWQALVPPLAEPPKMEGYVGTINDWLAGRPSREEAEAGLKRVSDQINSKMSWGSK